MENRVYKSGEIVPVSGIYYNLETKFEVTCNEGDPFPPSSEGFVLRRAAHHKK